VILELSIFRTAAFSTTRFSTTLPCRYAYVERCYHSPKIDDETDRAQSPEAGDRAMDRDRLLGVTDDSATDNGESFVEEHDRKWGKFAAIGGGLALLVLAKPIGAFIGVLVGTHAAQQVRSGYSETSASAQLRAGLEEAARQMRPQLPMQVDQITTLVGVITAGNRIMYTMTLSEDIPSREIAEATRNIQSHNVERVCGSQQTRRLIEAGGEMAYQYTDASGDAFATEVTSCAGVARPPLGGG
jgi:hypothetical protein